MILMAKNPQKRGSEKILRKKHEGFKSPRAGKEISSRTRDSRA